MEENSTAAPLDLSSEMIGPLARQNFLLRCLDRIQKSQAVLWTVGMSYAVIGLQLTQGILLARLLKPEGRGEYATVVFWSHLLMYVGLLGGIEVVCRYGNDSSIDQQPLRRSAFHLGLLTGLMSMAVALVGGAFLLPPDKAHLASIACLCALSVLAQNVILIMSGVDRGVGNFKQYNLRRIFAAAALPTLIVLSLPWTGTTISVGWVCLLYVFGSYAAMLFSLKDVHRPLTGETAKPVFQLLKECRPYAFSMFATDLFERLDTFLVLCLASFTLQGNYTAMIPVVYPLIVIPNTLGVFLFNAGAKPNTVINRRWLLKALGTMFAIQTMLTLAFIILAKPIIPFLYGAEFAAAVPIAYWLAPTSAVRGMVQGLEGFLKGRGRPQASLICRFVAAIVMAVLALAWYTRWNVIAVAMAGLIGQLLCFVWVAWLVDREIAAASKSFLPAEPSGEMVGSKS